MSRLIDADELREKMYHEAFEKDSDMQKWDSGCWIRYKMFENAIDDAPTVEPQQWIPCDKHPDTDRNVFIARGSGDFLSCCIGHYDDGLKCWYEDRNWFAKCLYDAALWCEMPTLPESVGGIK